MIRDATQRDAQAVSRIYNHYIEHTTVTFEERPVSPREMGVRIRDTVASFPWIVYEEEDALLGYAYATGWRRRSAYRRSVESTVYLAPGATGRGLGSALYGELIARLRARSFHTVIGGIALPDGASVALHERLGFRNVAHFHEVGRKFDRGIDVGYWELLLHEDA